MTYPSTSPLVALSRVFWMMVGPLALAGLAAAIIKVGTGWLTALDLAFLAVLGGMLLARWLEFRGGDPQTATGEPATLTHLRRYLLFALVLGLTVWVVANFVGNHWLSR